VKSGLQVLLGTRPGGGGSLLVVLSFLFCSGSWLGVAYFQGFGTVLFVSLLSHAVLYIEIHFIILPQF
jgi:hypothetical protein